MAGNQAVGMAKVKIAVGILQEALGTLPLGSEMHTEILKAVSNITKHMDGGGVSPSEMIQQMSALAQKARAAPPAVPSLQGGAPPPGAGAPPSPAASMAA